MKNTGSCFITRLPAFKKKTILNLVSNRGGRRCNYNVYSQWAMVVSVQERMGCGPNSKVTAPRVHQDVQLMRTERPRHIKSACTLCWCKTKSVCGFHLRISWNNEIIASCPVSLQCPVSFPCALHALPWPRLSRSSSSSLHLSLSSSSADRCQYHWHTVKTVSKFCEWSPEADWGKETLAT